MNFPRTPLLPGQEICVTRNFAILFEEILPVQTFHFSKFQNIIRTSTIKPLQRTSSTNSTTSFQKPIQNFLPSQSAFQFTKMGNKNKSVGPPTVAQRIAAQAAARARIASPPSPPSRVKPVDKCEDPSCPITHPHGAREYLAGDKWTPKYILFKEEALKHRLDNNLPIFHDDKKLLNRWYAVHDTSRLMCDTVECPLRDFHLAKEFKAGLNDAPPYVRVKEERARNRLGRGLSIFDDDKIFLNKWYALHDPSRHLDMQSIPRPVKCEKPCGLKSYHVDKVFEEGADDLPKTIKEFSAKVDAAIEQNVDAYWYEYKILCQFFEVHGPKDEEVASGPSATVKEPEAKAERPGSGPSVAKK